jgi:hypothetical protein
LVKSSQAGSIPLTRRFIALYRTAESRRRSLSKLDLAFYPFHWPDLSELMGPSSHKSLLSSTGEQSCNCRAQRSAIGVWSSPHDPRTPNERTSGLLSGDAVYNNLSREPAKFDFGFTSPYAARLATRFDTSSFASDGHTIALARSSKRLTVLPRGSGDDCTPL